MTISYRGSLGEVLDGRRRAAEVRIRNLSSHDLAARSHEDIVENEMRSISFEPLAIDFEHSYSPGPPVQGTFEVPYPGGVPNAWGQNTRRVVGATYTIRIPFTGSRELIDLEPHGGSGMSNAVPLENATIADSTVVLTVRTIGINPTDAERTVRQAINFARSWLEQQGSWANAYLAGWAGEARKTLLEHLAWRVAMIDSNRAVLESLGIPLIQSDSPIPLTRKPAKVQLSPTTVSPATTAASSTSDYRLDLSVYEDIVETITNLGHSVERTPITHQKLYEEDLRNVILFVLNANYRGQAVGEAFSGSGKTDILLMWQGKAAFIGECKMWEGQAALTTAINQLFGYTTWRDLRVALILFMRPDRMTENRRIADETVRAHPNFLSAQEHDRYAMRHPQDPERRITLAVLSFAATINESMEP